MTKPVPPKKLEKIVGALVPPACREHVLGDLYERYCGPWQYLCEALLVLPLLVLSRVRRTANPQTVVLEALVTYLSFAAAAWQFYGPAFLYDQSGLLRLALPSITALAGLLLLGAYDERGHRGLTGSLVAVALAMGAAMSFQMLLAGLVPRLRLPLNVLLAGGATSALLVAGLRVVLQPGRLRRFQQSLDCAVDPIRMSADQIRAAAIRMHQRARVVRIALCAGMVPPAVVEASAMWHSPSLIYRLGCGLSLAGMSYAAFLMERAFARGHLEANPSVAMCLEFCRCNLEGRREVLRRAWPRILGPLLAGTLIVLATDPAIEAAWTRIAALILVIVFYLSVGWIARSRIPGFDRQIEAFDQVKREL